jgi:hypothetical protein
LAHDPAAMNGDFLVTVLAVVIGCVCSAALGFFLDLSPRDS